ncbi:major latex protein 146-like [Chenopodium quinoa]|uniref:Bet v I/Major latex protein domain-containing protein n=1 Tax=Chenopodium quinoa TaxID=63459 RepID=A0A803L1I5_CHEQI|nr:major latex protein 146-like [Chenopodium quinoa]
MAQLRKLEGEVEVKCSAEMLFKMNMAKQPNIPNICSNMCRVEAHQDGKSEYLIERIEANDEKNKIIHRSAIDGDIMKTHCKTFSSTLYIIPKGHACCVVKITLEYEKMNEDAPEPHQLLHFGLAIFKDLARHLTNAN